RRFPRAEALETAAGAGETDRHPHVAAMRQPELLGDRFGDRIDGTRAVDLDRAAQIAARRGVATTATRGHRETQHGCTHTVSHVRSDQKYRFICARPPCCVENASLSGTYTSQF